MLINSQQPTALEAFVGIKAEIDALLTRIAAASDDHFHVDPQLITWSDAMTLTRYRSYLKEVSDMIHREGEYAPAAAGR